jgi:REP-associated tyrosine transposase
MKESDTRQVTGEQTGSTPLPVRAGMVAHAWDYPWSSAAAHCGEGSDPSGLLALSAWFEGMSAKQWKATLKAIAGSDVSIERLRIHTRTGRPLGSDAFLSKVEALIGKRVRPLPVGRQKGWRKKKAK